LNREIKREQTRLRVAKHRGKKEEGNKDSVTGALRSVTPASASAVTSDKERGCGRKPKSREEVIIYATTLGISQSDAIGFFDSQESGGWTRGGKPLHDWKAALRTWNSNGFLPSQKSNGKFSKPKEGKDPYEPMSDKLWQLKHGQS
jgi:hypothetical protein